MRKEIIKKLWIRLARYRILVVISILMAGVTVAGTLYLPILMGDAIDCIIGKGKVDFPAMIHILGRAAVTVIITAMSQWIMNVCNNRVTYHMTRDIRNEAIARIVHLPISYIDGHSYGDIVSRVITDVDTFADGLLMGFTQFFTGVLTIAATLIFIFSIHPGIALLVVGLTPVSLLVARFIARRTYDMFRLQSEARGQQTALIEEMIDGEKVVKAFGYEDRARDRFKEINDRLASYSLRAIFFSSITNPSTRFVNSLVYAGVALSGALTAIGGGLSVGMLTCLLAYANQYTKPFNEISGVVTELQNAIACAGRILDLVEEETEPEDIREEEIESDKRPKKVSDMVPAPGKAERGQEGKEKTAAGNIALSHVFFSYQKDKKLIEDLNLDVRQGQRIAIVGPTGCGKTTLINLLMRFYEVDAGSISVDGTDIRKMTRDSLRASYGMVLQDTWIRSGTVRENICMGRTWYSDEEIIRAAKLAHSWEFIRRMPQRLDTIISEEDTSMSQGQKQLLCITRVMLEIPAMLILDEATSSIDTRTEIRIQDAFSRMMEGRTSFIVAHRLSTIRNAHVILVMKDGHIIEQGNHEELLEKGGFYSTLYYSQFDLSEDGQKASDDSQPAIRRQAESIR